MTSRSSQFEYIRIPDEKVYEQAFQILQESFIAQGGPTAAINRLRKQVANGQQTRIDYTALGSSSQYLEELSHDGVFEDRAYASLHAFNRGFFIGQEVVELVYDKSRSYSVDCMQTTLSAFLTPTGNLENATVSSADLHRVKGLVLKEKGDRGLSLLNSRSTEQLEQWADEVYPYEERPNRCYRLGVGAVLYCGQKVFEVKHATSRRLDDIHILEKIAEYENPDTGELE
jgi:hypothetical protein